MRCWPRQKTRPVRVGQLVLGKGAPILVQSMTNTPTHEVRATLAQIRRLARAGCEIVRCAVPDQSAVKALPRIVHASPLPVVADIHFDRHLALAAIQAGVAKIRINPGNLGWSAASEVARAAAQARIPVRIGVNAGSLPERERQRAHTPEALGRLMAHKALLFARHFERLGLKQIVLSVKASDIPTTLVAYRWLSQNSYWPLHLGLTEAGGLLAGAVKTAAGIAPLLLEGIGDTLRVSLTADPVYEVQVADYILSSLGLRRRRPEIISCPTCGRTVANLPKILRQVEKALAQEHRPWRVAVMGCIVNGPGEARHADLGLAGAPDGSFLLFAQGRPLYRVPETQAVAALVRAIQQRDKSQVVKS